VEWDLPYLNDEQKSLVVPMKEFCEREVNIKFLSELADKPLPPNATWSELQSRVPWDLINKAHGAGLRQLSVPEEYGGEGYGVLENALVVEAFCCQDSGLGIALGVAYSSEIISRYGNEEQKGRYLSLIQGKAISCRALPKPTTAVKRHSNSKADFLYRD
jgi:alkylation response protein AidB-like acyl-CoA dehydrogenase